MVRTLPSGLAAGREYLTPVAVDLLKESEGLTDEERAVVGAYLEAVTSVFSRHARGESST